MMICPDCRTEFAAQSAVESCNHCGWQQEVIEGLRSFLRTKKASYIADYIENYKTISEDDLATSILPKEYLDYQAQKLLKYAKLDKSSKICDIGGGQGYFARACKNVGFSDVSVVDIAIPYLNRLADNFDCYISNAENLPFKNHFDAIFASDVLEHVVNLGSFLYCANQALVEGGKFVVRVPFEESLLSYSPHMGCKYDFVHLRSFDRKILHKTLSTAGFKVKSFYYDGFWLYLPKDYIGKLGITKAAFHFYSRLVLSKDYVLDNTLLAKLICKIFLRPVEIICVAEKISDIAAPT